METFVVYLFALFAMLSVPFYILWQPLVLIQRRGWGRMASAVPLVPMAVVMVFTIGAYQQDSNLWPLMLIFAAPFAVIWLWLVGLFLPAR